LQDVGALLTEQAGELRLFARFQDEDAVSAQSVGHDPALENALTNIRSDLFILTPP
jgi:hypothetical protein